MIQLTVGVLNTNDRTTRILKPKKISRWYALILKNYYHSLIEKCKPDFLKSDKLVIN